jgi:hypothetical protein
MELNMKNLFEITVTIIMMITIIIGVIMTIMVVHQKVLKPFAMWLGM